MGFVIPIALAKLLFYSVTLWNAFKALKVPKHRRKIPRPVLNRETNASAVQTAPSCDPLSAAQKTRRTRIKEMTKVCLVWVVWTHSKRFLDWIAWAIPWYDEFNFAFLVWLIIMGPSAADTVFRHTIQRMAAPYEQSFDLTLGTTHEALQLIMYLITCGPKTLHLKWERWKARQFNKSLLSTTNATVPPSRLPVLNPYSSRFQHLKPQQTLPSDRAVSNTVSSTSANSPYLLVPERKPILSRKLSAGYKRAVSNSRPQPFLGDPGLFSTRSVSTNRAVYPFRSAQGSGRSGTSFATSIENQPLRLSAKINMQQPKTHSPHHPDVKPVHDQEDEINSIIIHDDSLISAHDPSPAPADSIYGPPVKVGRQKRTRNTNDELEALALRKAKKAIRISSTKRPEKASTSKTKKAPIRGPTVTSASTAQITQEPINPSGPPAAKDTCDAVEDNVSWQLPPNAALPRPDPTLSPSKAPAPTVKRRLHNPDEPLPLSKSLKIAHHGAIDLSDLSQPQHQHIREQALDSVRSLTSTDRLPSLNRSTGRLASRFPPSSTSTSNRSASTTTTSPHSKKPSSSPSKPKHLVRKREISGKVGQQNVRMVAKKFDLLHSSPRPSSSSKPYSHPSPKPARIRSRSEQDCSHLGPGSSGKSHESVEPLPLQDGHIVDPVFQNEADTFIPPLSQKTNTVDSDLPQQSGLDPSAIPTESRPLPTPSGLGIHPS
ncbi:hypothetical protein PTTG_05156 [Puccinia triticina 1-1 BBBD Race 1]|uniref:Protein YOP1 n=1 Tax=Puccinia triticina (isolate 1-1 / race 1 (BBBD)) TaxID=630390 RepID=A0A0C4EWG1_PUCT1|nr:hypothetical protein PTTG_05156 [Puccinia triticina 1-1 BBBD Race 1]